MSDQNIQSVLATELMGGFIAEHVQNPEVSHAMERCTRRIDLAVSAQGGIELSRTGNTAVFGFESCDKGVFAAGEILEKLASVPPVGGTRIGVKIALLGREQGSNERDLAEAALKLTQAAQPGQALASESVITALQPGVKSFAGSEILHGKQYEHFDWPVYLICKRAGMVTSIVSKSRLSPRLRVRHQQNVILVEDQRPVLLIGREMGNDLVVPDPRASRQHARIELQQSGFVLIDESSNGTYISVNGASEYNVKNGEFVLEGSGRIGCGFSVNDEIEEHVIYFDPI